MDCRTVIAKAIEQVVFTAPEMVWKWLSEKKLYKNMKFALYGAGGHTLDLLKYAKQHPKGYLLKNLVAIFDKNAARISSIFGFPVLPPAQMQNADFDLIFPSTPLYENMILEDITKRMGNSKAIRIYTNREFIDFAIKEEIKKFQHIPGKKHKRLLYINCFWTPTQNYLAQLLKEDYAFELYKINIGFTRDIENEVYDGIFGIGILKEVLPQAIAAIDPDYIFLNTSAGWHPVWLNIFIKQHFPHIPLIHEMCDWFSLYAENDTMLRDDLGWEENKVILNRCGEDFALHEVNGLIFKVYDYNKVKDIKKHPTVPYISLLGYLPRKLKCKPKEKSCFPPRLVYAGSLEPSSSTNPYCPDIKLLSLFKDLTNQNLFVDMFSSHPDNKYVQSYLREYLEESQSNPLLKFHFRLSHSELIKKINRVCDYGLMLYYYNYNNIPELTKRHIRNMIPVKFFTYLSAGLPVLVSEECEAVAEIVEAEKIGLVLTQTEIKNLSNILTKINYKDFKKNICAFQEKYALEEHVDRFVIFLQNIKWS